MKLLEYQAKQQFRTAGIDVPAGRLARSPDEAAAVCAEIGRIAIKAQVPVGGRGKAGGVAVVDTPDAAKREAKRILELSIAGYPVRSVWCETGLLVDREFYLGITLDRERRRMALIFSAAGGVEIETVAEQTPDKIFTLWPDPFRGPQPYELRRLAFDGLRNAELDATSRAAVVRAVVPMMASLFDLAHSMDALTCEINPLVLTQDGKLIAADGKIEIDDSAVFRHGALAEELTRDSAGDDGSTGDDPYEVEARRRGLTYVHLNGYVGCIGNGAGLVMNTLDLVKQQGGEPANFLDVGGGASADKVRDALDMVLLDPAVRGVFINIFGGITRCDEVARGIIAARDALHITKPLVVRMTGTSEEEGRRLLEAAGITPGVSATDAARSVVALTKEGG